MNAFRSRVGRRGIAVILAISTLVVVLRSGIWLRAYAAVLFALVIALAPARVSAHAWDVLNDCAPGGTNPYFYAGGPPGDWSYWSWLPSDANCFMSTHAVTGGTPSNHASYYLPISSSYNHQYYARHFIPCHSAGTTSPIEKWRIYPHGTGGGYSTITRSIDPYCDQLVLVTQQSFWGSEGGYIQMVDISTVFYSTIPVDTMKYRQ